MTLQKVETEVEDWISNGSEVIEGSQKDPVCRSWAGGEGGGRGVDQEGGVAGQAH